MESLNELAEYVSEKAKQYLEETGETIDKYPTSIVDFVIEYAMGSCNFPKGYTEKRKVADLERAKNSLAMACNDIYSKVGAEGQTAHSEGDISRSYESSWINPRLLDNLPNYVTIIS